MSRFRRKPYTPEAIKFGDITVTLTPGGWIHCSCGSDFIGTDTYAAITTWMEHAGNSDRHKPKEAA